MVKALNVAAEEPPGFRFVYNAIYATRWLYLGQARSRGSGCRRSAVARSS
jgi:hypothetical protein